MRRNESRDERTFVTKRCSSLLKREEAKASRLLYALLSWCKACTNRDIYSETSVPSGLASQFKKRLAGELLWTGNSVGLSCSTLVTTLKQYPFTGVVNVPL
jgi:hypothetical protein